MLHFVRPVRTWSLADRLETAAALISIHRLHVKEGVGIAVSVALEESYVRARALLNCSSTVSISTAYRRAVETGWTLALVPSDAVAKWQGTVAMLYIRTASVRTIDRIVPVPRRAGIGVGT